MSWENRHGKRVYYMARCENGRVIKTFLGDGVEAQKAAAEVDRRRQIREQAVAEVDRIKATCRDASELSEDFDSHLNELINGALHAAGFHRHARGEWRRRRHV